MINAKIQFSWNVGAGVGSVTSDLPIQSEANFINTIDKWYHVKADRSGDYLSAKKHFSVDLKFNGKAHVFSNDMLTSRYLKFSGLEELEHWKSVSSLM